MRASLGLALVVSLAGCDPFQRSDKASLVRQLDREVIALRIKNEQLEGRLLQGAGHSETPNPIYAELVQVFTGSEVEVVRSGNRTVVTLPSSLLFGSWGLTVRQEAAMTLDLLATALKLHPELKVVVVGHIDDAPMPAALRRQVGSAWELGAIRAAATARALIETYGVPGGRFMVASRGMEEPLVSNDTPEGRSRNRRVVLTLTPAFP
jgi:flagellar motor protein MotB